MFQNCKRTALILHLYGTTQLWKSLQSLPPLAKRHLNLHLKILTNIPCRLPLRYHILRINPTLLYFSDCLRFHSTLHFFDLPIDDVFVNEEKWMSITLKNPSEFETLDKDSQLIVKIIFLKTPSSIVINSKKFSPLGFRKTCFS